MPLAGQVDSYAAKWNVEKVTQGVVGVKRLAIDMTVNIPGFSKRSDADIARSVSDVLHWTSYLDKDAVNVMVENGWVTLSGEVESEYPRHTAENAIRYLLGVTDVSKKIVMKPKVSLLAAKSDIEKALKRQASSDAQKISVAIQGSDVTLSGSVRSWSERELARHFAWNTPGVTRVVDKMSISF